VISCSHPLAFLPSFLSLSMEQGSRWRSPSPTGSDGGASCSGLGSDSSDDEMPFVGTGSPRPLLQDDGSPGTDDLEALREQVSAFAAEYRENLGRRVAGRRAAAAASGGPHQQISDLEILAEDYTSELGVVPSIFSRGKRRSESDAAASEDPPSASCSSDAPPLPPPVPRDESTASVILFDWDDTLFPTAFLQEMVLPKLPAVAKETGLPADSQHFNTLAAQARMVRAVLTIARTVAQVAIVTLAVRPWVTTSSDRWLPGLNITDLLRRLGIPVYYARENVKRSDACLAQVEEGVDLFTVAKRATMMKCLRKLYGKRSLTQAARMNVISIGDSLAEKEALKEVLWASCESQRDPQGKIITPLCKTVKFFYQPSAAILGDQLQLVAMWLRRMAVHSEDFDVSMDSKDLRRWGPKFLMPEDEISGQVTTEG